MLADYFTKPLQGSLFRKFRSIILGHAHISTLVTSPLNAGTGERVESENPGHTTGTPGHTTGTVPVAILNY